MIRSSVQIRTNKAMCDVGSLLNLFAEEINQINNDLGYQLENGDEKSNAAFGAEIEETKCQYIGGQAAG